MIGILDTSVTGDIIAGIVIGMILSCFSVSFMFFLAYYVVIECLFYFTYDKWNAVTGVAVLFSYVLGWIIGRTVYDMDTYFSTDCMDEQLGC